MPFACEKFQNFHFGIIDKFFKNNNYHVQFFSLFIAFKKKFIKHIKVIWCQGK
jgi:hypothetical protein